MYKIILASGSPRRKEIMETMGIPFEVIGSDVIEVVSETKPSEMVQALARIKAEDVALKIKNRLIEEELIIIGADTMVFHNGKALGKPKDEVDAINMITELSGSIHEVLTGVFIIINGKIQKRLSFSQCTKVEVYPMTREHILNYVKSKEPMDKAGAYGIQGKFGVYIKEIEGDYYNVVGFPIAKIYHELISVGIDIENR